MTARDRITAVVEKWFLVEPLLFAVWTTHELAVNPRIRTIRVHQGRVEYNPAFIDSLDRHQLDQVLALEAMRILLKHPYARRPENAEMAYAASNLTLQEYLETSLPLPRAREVFGDPEFDKQYYEFYYHKLLAKESEVRSQKSEVRSQESAGEGAESGGERAESDGEGAESGGEGEDAGGEGQSGSGLPTDGSPSALAVYADAGISGRENTEAWELDELRGEQINDRIRTAKESGSWGSIPGRCKERILAALRPKLNYRAVLRQFRASVLSVHRRLTRMKPNRRYGFAYMGSRYDFTTRLLFAVDVSGSMSSSELALGFSVVNRFFKYGIMGIDVIQFDTEIQGDPMSLKRACHSIEVTGRGGTSFDPVMQYLDEHREYDGAIIFTDGVAPVPCPPKNRRTRVLWLFNNEAMYLRQHEALRAIGRAAFLKEDRV